jgi:predicted permease
MRDGGPALPLGRRRASRGAVVVQIAVSLVLLVAAGLCLRSMWSAREADLGFDPGGAVVATFAPHLQGYDRNEADRFYRSLLAQVRALPTVEAAGLASHLPLTFELRSDRVRAAEAGEDDAMRVDSALVGFDYFAAMGIQMLEGLGLLEDPVLPGRRGDREREVVINTALARRVWPEGGALGQRLVVEGLDGSREVVGIVETGKARTLGEAPRPFLFRPFETERGGGGGGALQVASGTVTLVVRAEGDLSAAMAAVQRSVRELDPQIATSRLTTLDAAVAPALLLPRAAAALFGLFGVLGLVLAAVGTYGLMAHATGARRHEIGIRLAIGASRGEVESLLVREGVRLAVVGIGCGLILSAFLGRFLEPILFGVDATDPIALAVPALVLFAVATAASYLPAHRAARVEASAALRYE